jgi:hypothetical protein
MKNYRAKKQIENFFRMTRGEITLKEMQRLNHEIDNPQLPLGIGAATEPPRRTA